MKGERADEILARILREPGDAVVATDGDGTLWSGDVGDELFDALCDSGRIGREAHEALAGGARAHGLDDSGDAAALARRLFAAHHEGAFPELTMFEAMAWLFAGWTRPEVDAFARDTLTRTGIATRLHPELTRILEGAARAGREVIVVSASPRAAVEAALALSGATAFVSRVIAADAVWDGETMRADAARPIPYAEGKLATLRAAIGDRCIAAAFGDNAFDLAMLEASRVPVAVRPKARLRARAAALPRMLELLPLDA